MDMLIVIIHFTGVLITATVALFDIESIVWSGPIFSVYSLLIAIFAYRRNRTICLYYAFATPTVSVFCFAIIFGRHWSPGDARIPIGISLAIFGLINVPFGLLSIHESKRTLRRRHKGPFQFSIAAIMGLTLVVAVSLSLSITFGDQGIALAVILCYVSMLFYILRRYHKLEYSDDAI
jgi:hypothetical protein